ncbi:MAG: SDR family oxidoreductase [Candidatus Symbiobacter sp.]|nr:SDR family oxidoreductase [Candidatus Symbiobacter sp.]
MQHPYFGKHALVTAAGQGIGKAAALALAEAGLYVTATDINDAALKELATAHPNITARKLDVLDKAAIEKLFAEFGDQNPVSVLFNCAGFVHAGTIMDMQDAELDFAFDLNVKAMIRMIRAALPAMLKAKDGVIINMASAVGSLKGAPNRFVYGVTKAAVVGLTKAVAADYVTQGIRCNAICPGTVESPSLQDRMRAGGDYEKSRAAFIARQAMGRLGTPEEIADLVVYLAGASFTTGQTHVIDGGWTL